jgi:hypothetical protein
MSKIEVGEYMRTDNGEIHKVLDTEKGSIKIKSQYKEWIGLCCIKKHSKQLIDLIEVGDIVNGMEVLDIHKPRDLWEPIEIRVDSRYTNFILAEDIQTILTKESYMANCYKKVGGEDE